MRMTLGDVLMSLGAIVVLLLALLAVDHRVRDEISLRMAAGQSSTEMLDAGTRIEDYGRVIYAAAREQTRNRAPLVIFIVVAAGLVTLMVRT